MGSKNKIAKHILPIMLERRKPGQWWVEPFVGGANVIDKVLGNRIGNDINKYLIHLLRSVQNGWIPPKEVSKETYQEIKNNPTNYRCELVGFVGFACSFGGKWFGGYAQDKEGRNYAANGSNSLARQAKNIKNVKFVNGSYLDLLIPSNSIIYCDPPYERATAYQGKFDHKIFWQWCRDKATEGHTVFVSEYNAPDDFTCIKEIEHSTTMNKNKKSKRVERLFKLQ